MEIQRRKEDEQILKKERERIDATEKLRLENEKQQKKMKNMHKKLKFRD